MPTITSPFLHPGPLTTPSTLSILHLKRDLLLPTVLLPPSAPADGYAEGPVTNTRFGSFPHSTLIDIPWGSQVRASAVDTGSRGRKRKRSPVSSESQQQEDDGNTAVIAQLTTEEAETPQNIKNGNTHRGGKSAQKREEQKQGIKQRPSGFIHILPPTPESWTLGLPHRTQVVYTPDYSYILHKLRVRPGTRIIEAGAGSGSFTHAAARAVFGPTSSTSTSPSSASPSTRNLKADAGGVDATIPTIAAAQEEKNDDDDDDEGTSWGKVHSYEFHALRHEKLVTEIHAHGLSDTVTLHLRDVCASGFLATDSASAIFLDLPAPWLALPHLTRSTPTSPLDPTRAARICTFSPCIEQVDRTVSTLRKFGWVDIEMSALAARRIEVRREKVGVGFAGRKGERGVSGHPCDVGEAVGRGREVEERGRKYHERMAEKERRGKAGGEEEEEEDDDNDDGGEKAGGTKAEEGMVMEGEVKIPAYKEGRLVTRSETEIKEHTSYLVFAVLPMAWTEEDETRAAEKAAQMGKEAGEEREMSRAMGKKARKRAAKEAAEGRNKGKDEAEAGGNAGTFEGDEEGDDVGDVKITIEGDGAVSVDEGGDVKMEEAEQSRP